jgi:putative Mn2+ efflux pump MntP
MNILSTVLLALAMSTDAFAAAVCKGTALERPRWSEALRIGAIFGVIEGLTPVAGWLLGLGAANYIKAWDHWIAFLLLGGLGVRMMLAGMKPPEVEAPERPTRHSFWLLAVTGFATSIDALVVGVGLAFLDTSILRAAAAIGVATFLMVTIGVMVGRALGAIAGKRTEVLGGIVLIGIGVAILYEHLNGV